MYYTPRKVLEEERDSLEWYVRELGEHIDATRQHFLGTSRVIGAWNEGDGHKEIGHLVEGDDAREEDDEDDEDGGVDQAGATWTASEKDLLFANLSRYSRHQPSLIARHLPTKSATQVAAYVAKLHKAAERHPIPWGRGDVEGARQVGTRWGGWESWAAHRLAAWQRSGEERRKPGGRPERHFPGGAEEDEREVHTGGKRKRSAVQEPTEMDGAPRRKMPKRRNYYHLPRPQTSYTPLQLLDLQTTLNRQLTSLYTAGKPRATPSRPTLTPSPTRAARQLEDEDGEQLITPEYLDTLSPVSRRQIKERLRRRKLGMRKRGKDPNMVDMRVVIPKRPGGRKEVPSQSPGELAADPDPEIRAERDGEDVVQGFDGLGGEEGGSWDREEVRSLSLLRHKGFAELMQTYYTHLFLPGHQISQPPPPPSISHSTLLLLAAHVRAFLTQLLHRTIVLAELDVRFRQPFRRHLRDPEQEGNRELVTAPTRTEVWGRHVRKAVALAGGGGVENSHDWWSAFGERLGLEVEEDERGEGRSEQDGEGGRSARSQGAEEGETTPEELTGLYAYPTTASAPDWPDRRDSVMRSPSPERVLEEIEADLCLARSDAREDKATEAGLWSAIGGLGLWNLRIKQWRARWDPGPEGDEETQRRLERRERRERRQRGDRNGGSVFTSQRWVEDSDEMLTSESEVGEEDGPENEADDGEGDEQDGTDSDEPVQPSSSSSSEHEVRRPGSQRRGGAALSAVLAALADSAEEGEDDSEDDEGEAGGEEDDAEADEESSDDHSNDEDEESEDDDQPFATRHRAGGRRPGLSFIDNAARDKDDDSEDDDDDEAGSLDDFIVGDDDEEESDE